MQTQSCTECEPLRPALVNVSALMECMDPPLVAATSNDSGPEQQHVPQHLLAIGWHHTTSQPSRQNTGGSASGAQTNRTNGDSFYNFVSKNPLQG